MFGFSLTKLLFTIGVVVAVWRGFKLFETFKRRLADDDPPEAKPARAVSHEVELVACPNCGRYTPKGQYCTCRG